MSANVIVENFVIKDLRPQLKSNKYEKYLPKTLFRKYVTFDIYPISNAVMNAIRRTVGCELLVNALYGEYYDLNTDDVFIIPEMVLARLRMVPLDQSCPLDARFNLSARNETTSVRDVKSSEIAIVHNGKVLKSLPFNETFTLLTLMPGKSITIDNISVHQSYACIAGNGMHTVALNARGVALDQVPINTHTNVSALFEEILKGTSPDESAAPISESAASSPSPNIAAIHSSMSNPRKWRISFTTHGTMEPNKILANTCDNIIMRVSAVRELLYSISNNGDEYVLSIPGETHTISNLFTRTINDLYPDIGAAVPSVPNIGRQCTIRVRCDEDINTVYETTINYLVELFTSIKGNFV